MRGREKHWRFLRFSCPVWINKPEERTGGKKAHHGGKQVDSSVLAWRRHPTDFFLEGRIKISQPAPELLIGSFFSFITDSRRIYSLLQTSSARCLRSSTAGAQFDQIKIIDGTDAVVICLGKRKRDKNLKEPPSSVLRTVPEVFFNRQEGWRRSGDEARLWVVASGRRCFFFSCGKVRDANVGTNLLPVWNIVVLSKHIKNGTSSKQTLPLELYILKYLRFQ